jgi:hypothetical protein
MAAGLERLYSSRELGFLAMMYLEYRMGAKLRVCLLDSCGQNRDGLQVP